MFFLNNDVIWSRNAAFWLPCASRAPFRVDPWADVGNVPLVTPLLISNEFVGKTSVSLYRHVGFAEKCNVFAVMGVPSPAQSQAQGIPRSTAELTPWSTLQVKPRPKPESAPESSPLSNPESAPKSISESTPKSIPEPIPESTLDPSQSPLQSSL